MKVQKTPREKFQLDSKQAPIHYAYHPCRLNTSYQYVNMREIQDTKIRSDFGEGREMLSPTGIESYCR